MIMDKLFQVAISSWNAQGGSQNKLTFLDGVLSESTPNILLLQEEGVPGTTGCQVNDNFVIGTTNYKCVIAAPDPTAQNLRCSIAILVEEELLPHVSNAGIEVHSVQRPLCYIDLASGIRIATMHAIADESQSVTEVRDFINYLDNYGMNWILMGDFNSTPGRYPLGPAAQLFANRAQTIQYAGSSTRNQQYCNMIFDVNPTQGAGGNRVNYLDFAFFREPAHGFQVQRLRNITVTDNYGNPVSDHNLIQLVAAI